MPPKKRKEKRKEVIKPKKDPQKLNIKDQALFEQLRRFFEKKQYKKGIRVADQILKKNPNHGETLCFKGLVLNAMDKKKEAEVISKKGLMLNLKSQMSWHVHGLIYRSKHQYDDAIKCYQRALKSGPEDFKILKDLGLLQVQRRMMDGYQETCRKILVGKPSNRNNWLAYAIGNHLNKNYKKAFEILTLFHGAFDPKDKKSRDVYAHSELKLYYNMVLEDSGDLAGALKHLSEIEDEVVDKLSLWEKRAELNVKLGNLQAAERNYRDLIDYQPETYKYYHGLRQAMKLLPEKKESNDQVPSRPQKRQQQNELKEDFELTDAQIEKLDKLFDEIHEAHPKAAAPKRLRLNYCKIDVFRERIDDYMITRIRKGVPALFRDIRNFYVDDSKVKIIEEALLGYVNNLRSDLRFKEDGKKGAEAPSVFGWALYFLSQHYDFIGCTKEALEVVNEAIKHTPTNIELYILKARIYKHAGDMDQAFENMNFARELDTADRYTNTKCVRYALRANLVREAENIVSLFFREGDGLESLFEMQVMWYELSSGDSYLQQQKYGKALKQYLSVGKHFHTICEDQFDFHSYCLRKTTLRAYVRMLRWQDNLKSHRFFYRAARSIVKTYIILYDLSLLKKDDTQTKKPENKSRPQEKTKKQKQEEKEEKDLVEASDLLGEAMKQLKDLQLYLPQEITTHILSIDVYSRKKKYLLVLKSLKTAFAIDQDHPDIHFRAMDFWKKMENQMDNLHPVVKSILQEERKTDTFWNERPLEAINEEYLKKHPNSLRYGLAVTKSMISFGGNTTRENAFQIISNISLDKSTLQECNEVLDWLEKADAEKKTFNSFFSACSERFPYATRFKTN